MNQLIKSAPTGVRDIDFGDDVDDVTTFRGNTKLKRAGEVTKFTAHQVSELTKCADDPIYFIRNYVKIVNVDRGFIPFEMFPFQEEMVRTFHDNRFIICMLPRQMGKTTTSAAYYLWSILFNAEYNIAILANKDALAREILAKVKKAYEALPKWIQQGVIVWNKGRIDLENGSRIIAAATSSDSIRGYSFSLLHLDEFAIIRRSIQDEFFTSVYPTISSGTTTKTIIVSTPKGMDLFYKLWQDANAKPKPRNLFKPVHFPYQLYPGRDEKWKRMQIAQIGQERFEQEYNCSFVGNSNTLIHPGILSKILFNNPIETGHNGALKIYEHPIKDHAYMILCDCAQGRGLDYSVANIVDISVTPFKQVAVFRDNKIPAAMFPNIIFSMAKTYNTAYVLLEINDVGYQVSEILYNELEYENIIITKSAGRKGQEISSGYGAKESIRGIKMTKSVKRIGCSSIKPVIENGKIILQDFDTIAELTTFVDDGVSYSAEDGCHDDICMTLVLFGWVIGQRMFKEMTGISFNNLFRAELEDIDEENILPMGIFFDTDEIYDDTPSVFGNNDFTWNMA